MIATIYQNANEFLQKTQTFLEENEAANSLMLGISFRLKQFPDRIKTTPYLITVVDGNELILAAVMTPPHNLVIYGHKHKNASAFEVLAQKLRADQVFPPGVLGPSSVANGFAKTWAGVSGGKYRQGMSQRIYELRKVIPPQQLPPGQMRPATESEVDLITQWALAFQEEALSPGDPEQAQEMVQQRISSQEFYVWDDGQSASVAAKARPISNGIMVNLVYTPPKFRRQGYASACVAVLSQLLLDSGWQFCALHADLSNPTSNYVYQAVGYRPVCDFNEYIFDVTA